MLQPFQLAPVTIDRSRYLPAMLAPLIEAAERGQHLLPALTDIVRGFGFDTFMYAFSGHTPKPANDSRMYVFTTCTREWVVRYDQRAYVEYDPRVLCSFESCLPLIWDQASERGKDTKTDYFLDDAMAHGIASGVSFSSPVVVPARTIFALNSPAPMIDDARRQEIARDLGNIVLFGQYFQELFLKAFLERGLAPPSQGAPLSSREVECLRLSSRGLTSPDIGVKLGISERTVNFHFGNILSKLDAVNRHEAIAMAVRRGLFGTET
jgi:DNA-binding CsgD family transcriptional regulator